MLTREKYEECLLKLMDAAIARLAKDAGVLEVANVREIMELLGKYLAEQERAAVTKVQAGPISVTYSFHSFPLKPSP